MAGWTNRGKFLMLGTYFQGDAPPANFNMALVTSALAPGPDHNTLGQFTEIGDTTGYTAGGQSIARSAVGFDVQTEDDGTDVAYVQLADVTWTASGGNLGPARYALLVTDEVTPADRQIIAYFDLGADRTVSTGQDLVLQNCELRLTE